ncbi:hypothetical protein ACOSQ2_026430 [Xanthoceras sorbifolium]
MLQVVVGLRSIIRSGLFEWVTRTTHSLKVCAFYGMYFPRRWRKLETFLIEAVLYGTWREKDEELFLSLQSQQEASHNFALLNMEPGSTIQMVKNLRAHSLSYNHGVYY